MINLYALGEPAITGGNGARLDGLLRQTKRFSLLVYLACAEKKRPHRRDELVAVFWPEADESHGRNALRQSLHVLRTAVGPDVIRGNGSEEVRVDPDRLRSDVRTFCDAIRSNSPEAALALYNGEFLSGFHLSHSPGFEDWVEARRRYLNKMAGNAAKDLAYRAEGTRDLTDALHWWTKALEIDRFNEAVLRRLMVLLAGSGNRGRAMSEFLRFRRTAQSELGAALSWDTLDLAGKISDGAQAIEIAWVEDRRKPDRPNTSSRNRRISDRVAS
jgi:DNA-binding SARP family transcriptional activator